MEENKKTPSTKEKEFKKENKSDKTKAIDKNGLNKIGQSIQGSFRSGN